MTFDATEPDAAEKPKGTPRNMTSRRFLNELERRVELYDLGDTTTVAALTAKVKDAWFDEQA